MARGVNRVILIGNLGAEPDVRFLPSGNAVANFNLATSESWKDKQTGEQQERTEWHRVCVFGKLAEHAGNFLHKGSKVYIEGKLRTRKYQGSDGQDRYVTEVVVDINGQMQFLDSRQDGQPRQQPQQRPAQAPSVPAGGDDFDDGSDIPF